MLHCGEAWVSIPASSAQDHLNLVFTGTYEHSIDQKHRLAIPAELRGQIQRAVGTTREAIGLYVTIGADGPGGVALCLYTEEDFQRRAEQLDDSELDAQTLLDYERLLFSLARRVELDKQGRVRLPDNLLRRAGLQNDVVLLGVKDHLEVRDRQTWLDYVDQRLRENPEVLMNPRQAMRRPTAADR